MPGEEGEPVVLGDAIAAVGEDLGVGDPRTMARLVDAWPEMVGDAIAAHARIRSLRRGVLTIAVDAAPWATQLRYLESDIVARAAAVLGGDVREARVVVEAPGKDSPKGSPNAGSNEGRARRGTGRA